VQMCGGFGDECGDPVLTGGVAGDGQPTDLGGHGLGGPRVQVVDDHLGPCFGQSAGQSGTDPVARAGDHCPGSGQVHVTVPTDGCTAVEHQGVDGDTGGVVGEQEGHGSGGVLGYAETTHRVLGGDLFLPALVQGGSKAGLDHGGGDPVDPDVGGQLHRKFLGDVFDHCLGGAGETDAGGGVETCDRGEVDG